jgi:hypothetical protein
MKDDGIDGWHVVECPANVQFASVRKETGTHGKIYAIWECDGHTPCWISQSIPILVRAMNARVFGSSDKRLHASSIYRVLRGESQKKLHKAHRVVRFQRSELGDFNLMLQQFPAYFFVTKTPDAWRIRTRLNEEDASAVEGLLAADPPLASSSVAGQLLEAPAPSQAPTKAEEERASSEARPEEEELP